jgi:hypothetical protein
MVEKGWIQALLSLLSTSQETNLLKIALVALEGIFKVGEFFRAERGINPFVRVFDEENGGRCLEELQNHKDDAVYNTVTKIIETFFIAETLPPTR